MTTFRRVLEYILDTNDNNPKRPPMSEEDLKLAAHLIDMGESINKGDYEISSEEHISHFEEELQDKTWTPEDEHFHNIKVCPDVVNLPGAPNMVQFSLGEYVELSKVMEAVEYYGKRTGFHNNGSMIRPNLRTMQHKYRFIKESHHLQKLREYESNHSTKTNRLNNLQFISLELQKKVGELIENGKILHDSVLRFLISEIIKKNNIQIENFVGSDSWLNGWKRRFGISSRKITKFVSQVRHKNRDQIERDSKEFVSSTNQILPLYHPSNVYNADQSGFQLEMSTARTLTFTGSRHVHCTVQNVSSTTHSYTVLPLISASGKLHPKIFVTLKEKNGTFPKCGHFTAPNLVVTCHTSHIMTKELMKTFFREVVIEKSMPKNALLIIDSWSSWKDTDAIDSVTPRANKIKILTIPAGCTGHVQPCDVGIFGAFKKVVKTITNYSQLTNEDYKMHSRDETLKLISLVWWQLCSPKLESWAQYAWFAAGYNVPRPPRFETPAQLLFPCDVAKDCAIQQCPNIAFMKCIYCNNHLCFEDFIIQHHKCC
ncbi:hypothetical protein B9Z55_027916 [Caenorhabditis nigoni]|uniref:HTH CENPB-type domain-containing protein n=1 Tax=Caenorhabditis nigoni TaxID=1611254 RepID=A0A2G5SED6_9PELO|nr:hypothetical protein B9Z55_027916 [Caenorhabditis nigoni]